VFGSFPAVGRNCLLTCGAARVKALTKVGFLVNPGFLKSMHYMKAKNHISVIHEAVLFQSAQFVYN
jgi:hypothetical protein